jgi:UDP-glucose 4-epimerase
MKALITGGAGYIGSTIASAMEDRGYTPVILDSLVQGREEFTRGRAFYRGDVGDRDLLRRVYAEHPDIACVIHCAALIVVPDSMERPYEYYRENVSKSLELFHEVAGTASPRVIFSSSASVYDQVPGFQVQEDSPLKADCPYARTKLMMEQVLEDFSAAYPLQGIALRYFNPIGADPALRSGAYVKNPSHLLGSLVDTGAGRRKTFSLCGVDWPTRDGSGIRDYIHVWDLARAHVQAMENFEAVMAEERPGSSQYNVINLGTEDGVTVKEFVAAFEKVLGQSINKEETGPRPGDVAGAYASSEKAKRLLGWSCEKTLEEGISDALSWDAKRASVLGY